MQEAIVQMRVLANGAWASGHVESIIARTKAFAVKSLRDLEGRSPAAVGSSRVKARLSVVGHQLVRADDHFYGSATTRSCELPESLDLHRY